MNTAINAIAWAGICLLVDYSMWKGNILSFYWEWLNSKKTPLKKVFGLCNICFGFWFGLVYLFIDYKNYIVFLGISEFFVIFFHYIKLFYRIKLTTNKK